MVSQPMKESKSRSQAVEEAIICLHLLYKKVSRAYIEVVARWSEVVVFKEEFLKQTKDESASKKDFNDKLAQMRDNIIADVKATVQEQLHHAIGQRLVSIDKYNESLKDDLQNDIKNMVSGEVKEAVNMVQKVVKDSVQVKKPMSYASITGKSAMHLKNKDLASRSKQLIEFIVTPLPESAKKFKSASEVKKVLKESINPTEYDLKVDHLFTLGALSVKIIASSVNLDKIRDSLKLKEAGLMIKVRSKLRPRLVIRNMPSDVSFTNVPRAIVESADVEVAEIKPITEFIRSDKSRKNVIVEVSPEIRNKLVSQGKIYFGYEACKVEDYISILQCYKCMKFNHLAKNCTADTSTCGHCAGSHDSRKCECKTKLRCVNCDKLGYMDIAHSALDSRKCPVILKRIEERMRSTDYGLNLS
ncbi:unnamed protein product [Xylocopa violacea]|uniref:CCHC-type domain-containing protein n=1 Tax=Xylocopa violacea TaxID=135666 RepID=A0ABP1NII1_XYLVO